MSAESRKGFLVVFEGIDGTGKSTHADILAEAMRARGLSVLQSREPTQGEHGRRIRESAATGRLAPAAELDLFMRDRREHVANVLQPALDAGTFVVVDRYYLSTAAYQGARGLDPEAILAANEAFAPIPDIAILFQIAVDDGRQRIRHRGDGDGDLFEREEDLRRVATVFAALDRPYIARIDGNRPLAEVAEEIRRRVESHPRFRELHAAGR
jgi:dTMP kinase